MSCIEEIKELSDAALYHLCQEYGLHARVWRRKFAGLLPEVQRRRLYRKRGCTSIHEFAAKLAGMSRESVNKVLWLYERLKDKPKLLEQLVSGEVGWSKLEAVSFIATKETDTIWAEKTAQLSRIALVAEVRQERMLQEKEHGAGIVQQMGHEDVLTVTNSDCEITAAGGSDQTIKFDFEQASERYTESATENRTHLGFHINPEVEKKLKMFKQGLEESRKIAVTYNEVLAELLKIAENVEHHGEKGLVTGKAKKQIVIEACYDCVRKKQLETELEIKRAAQTPSRHIPLEVQRVVRARYKGQCGWLDLAKRFGVSQIRHSCSEAAKPIHHLKPFSIFQSHDPDILVPLCEKHHELIHAWDNPVQQHRREEGAPRGP